MQLGQSLHKSLETRIPFHMSFSLYFGRFYFTACFTSILPVSEYLKLHSGINGVEELRNKGAEGVMDYRCSIKQEHFAIL
jgi:hypothetical protein